MHSPLSLQSFWLPQAFPMMHLRAVAEVAAFAVGEDFMAAACAPLSSGAALFTPDVQGDTGLLVARLPEEFTAMRPIAAHIEAQRMVWVPQR